MMTKPITLIVFIVMIFAAASANAVQAGTLPAPLTGAERGYALGSSVNPAKMQPPEKLAPEKSITTSLAPEKPHARKYHVKNYVASHANRWRLSSRGGLGNYPWVEMEATGYDPGPISCGPYADGHTATGMKAQHGVVAVDPRVIPLGTRLYIPGYGEAVAADVGSAIKGNRIDLCFNTYREAIEFGRRMIRVYVLGR